MNKMYQTKLNFITILILALLSFNTYAETTNQAAKICSNVDFLGKLPIQKNGRVKPLYVHANSLIKHLTHKTKFNGKTAVEIYCLMSLKTLFPSIDFKLQARIDHIKLQKFFNLTPNNRKIDFEVLEGRAKEVRIEMRKTPEGSYQKALMRLVRNISSYQNLISGSDWLMPNIQDKQITWIPVNQMLRADNISQNLENYKASNSKYTNSIMKVMDGYSKRYIVLKNDKHILEYKYAKANLPVYALMLTLIALLFTTVSTQAKVFLTPTFLTLILQTTYIALRVIISGRAPITNMYETVMFSGFGALVFSIVISHYKKDKLFLSVGLIYNSITIMMMLFASGMLNEEINPLVPVLRDNMWLSTHVTALLLSYGAFALSWILSNIILIKKSLKKMEKKEEKRLNDLIYLILKFGVTLLAAGIILGGIWADYSWGRFWGWDPKETWSLIVLCLYIAILHGKYTSWIPPKRFATLTAGAFLSVMMAWFGVNYILATGLHSYGFSEGGAIFLASFFMIQIVVLVITSLRINRLSK